MDWVTWKQSGIVRLQKYKYVLLVLLLGIFLMVLPEGKEPTTVSVPPQETVQPDLQESLAQILSRVDGAGRVEVLLTEAAGEKRIYQSDEDASHAGDTEDVRRSTVIVTNASREERGLIRQVLPPTYQGAIVLCQGADDARVRLAIAQAVMSVTGLRSDKITVLKMK